MRKGWKNGVRKTQHNLDTTTHPHKDNVKVIIHTS